jgi:pyruvate/2-oxoglutarate dehydrogenase complex dihydrolipoamide dehydrogenase (E3) component
MKVAVVERHLVGGTCVNTGCTPTKALIASAYAARIVRRAADYGVVIGDDIGIDMRQVKARKDAIVAVSRSGLTSALENAANITLYRVQCRRPGAGAFNVGGRALVRSMSAAGRWCPQCPA